MHPLVTSSFFICLLSSSLLPPRPSFLPVPLSGPGQCGRASLGKSGPVYYMGHYAFCISIWLFFSFIFVIPIFLFILFWTQTNRSTNRWPRLLIEMVLDAKLHFYHTRHVPNHSESLKFHFSPNLTKALPTNQPTNGPTDKASYRDA